MNRREFNRKTGIYRTQDAIENFKFRVSLQKIHSMVTMPQFDRTTEVDENETETVTIEWQQKLFSTKEQSLYSDAGKCQTDLHKRYHQQCISLERDMKTHQLFTYIADDDFSPSKECVAENPEHFWGPNDVKKYRVGICLVMYVMAELMEKVETVLFKIMWNLEKQTLQVYPDFNDFETDPYYKEIDMDIRQLYRYSIENISETETLVETHPKTFGGKSSKSISTLWPTLSTTLFAQPPRRCTFVNILMEIESAHDFENHNVHVRWNIMLPDHCHLIDETSKIDGILQGSTHSSLRSRVDRVCWLGYTNELSLLCTVDYNFKDIIHIIYEVVSIDSWQRERTEGFAAQAHPLIAGEKSSSLQCYRDLGRNTIWERLERAFIGGRSHTNQDDHFYMLESVQTAGSTALSRFGTLTKSSGKLCISLQTLLQGNITALNNLPSIDDQERVKGRPRDDTSKAFGDLEDILEAYEKAKQRLMATTTEKAKFVSENSKIN